MTNQDDDFFSLLLLMLSKGNKPWWSGSSAGDCPRARPARRRATVAPSASVAATAAATDKHWPFLRHPGTKENGSLGMSCRIDVNDVMRPLAILGRTFGAAGQTLDGAPDLVEPDERVGLVLVLQQQLQTQKRRHLKNDNQKKNKTRPDRNANRPSLPTTSPGRRPCDSI